MAGPITHRHNRAKYEERWYKRNMKAMAYRAAALAGGGMRERARRANGIVCRRMQTAEMCR